MVQTRERVRRLPVPEAEPPSIPPEPTVRDWSWVPFAILVGIAFALRLWDLGARAMHHDESLHALYSWYLYVGRGYTHDPMMHGPFLFHFTALLYMLFGDSEVTARLPMALLGTAAVGLPYFLRYELGRRGALAASFMLALDPAFLYMSRFGHNEGMLVFQTLLTVVGVFGWIRTRRSVYLYAAAVGLGIMFATKVVSLILGFTIFAFAGIALLVERRRAFPDFSMTEAVRDIGWRRFGTCAAIFLGINVVLYTTFFTNLEGLCTALYAPPFGSCAGKHGMLQYWYDQQAVARGSQPWFYYFLIIPLYEILPLVLALAAPFLARRPRTLFFWFTAWWALFNIFLYSYAGEKMPWLIVHPTIPLVLLGAQAIDPPLNRLRWPWGLPARMWAVVGLCLLAAATLVAWASAAPSPEIAPIGIQTAALRRVAIALVTAAILVGIFFVGSTLSLRQLGGALGTAGLIVVFAYSLHTAWQVTYKNGDIPVEMLVYVQSSPDIPFIVSELDRVGNQLGMRRDVPILLDGGYTETVSGQRVEHEAVSWPFEWYLRDFKGKAYYNKDLPADFSTNKYAALLIMGTSLDPVRDKLDGYTGNKFRLNWWYPEDYKGMSPSGDSSAQSFLKTFTDGEGREKFFGTIWWTLTDATQRQKLFKYVMYRELMNPQTAGLGARDLWFYVRNDLARGGGGTVAAQPSRPDTQTAPSQARGVELAVKSVTTFGRVGGQPVLKEPKGVALAPNGRVYVADTATSTIVVFNPDGSVQATWGRKGNGDGEFTEPWGVAVGPDGSVYVADTWNHRIQKFDADGRFLLKWGGPDIGSAQGQFYGPRDVVVTRFGEVLVTDTGNKRIQVFDERGAFRRAVGTEGTQPGQFREPVGLTVDREGRIYVADTWNQRIQVFDSGLQPVAQYPVQGWSSQSINNKPYLAVGPDGDIYATVPESRSLLRVHDGKAEAVSVAQLSRMRMPIGIASDGRGRIYIGDTQDSLVQALELDLTPPGGGAAEPPSEAP